MADAGRPPRAAAGGDTPMTTPAPARRRRPPALFDQRPMLVFWETTRACLLACRHCRASARAEPLPGELSHDEGRRLIDRVAGFGRPFPVLVLTGGDCLMRPDLLDLVGYATRLGVPVALSPSVTPLAGDLLDDIDAIRGVPGHFDATLATLRDLAAAGVAVQVNTTVMRANAAELADIAAIVARAGCRVWEVFFLVHVGRGTATGAISPAEHEEVCHFLYDASGYRLTVRAVEAPFFRRVAAQRRAGGPPPGGALYARLAGRLAVLLGPPVRRPPAHASPTRDGKGVIFVAHDGTVLPAGSFPSPSATSAAGRSARSTGMTRCCARSGRPSSPAAAAGASTPTCAGARGPAPTRPPGTRWAMIPRASWSRRRPAPRGDPRRPGTAPGGPGRPLPHLTSPAEGAGGGGRGACTRPGGPPGPPGRPPRRRRRPRRSPPRGRGGAGRSSAGRRRRPRRTGTGRGRTQGCRRRRPAPGGTPAGSSPAPARPPDRRRGPARPPWPAPPAARPGGR